MTNDIAGFTGKLLNKFLIGLPDVGSTTLLILTFIIWAIVCVKVPAYLKIKRNVRTGFTRKSFHFLVFISVSIINIIWDFTGVCLFGIIISSFIFYALFKGANSGLYLALAREADAPKSTLYIILPYLSTLTGGILLNIFYPEYVIVGYLICGLADASGEVIGTLYGKHRFQVKIFNFHKSFKSLEGCTSVFLLSFIVYTLYVYYHFGTVNFGNIALIILSSFIITVTEIISPKGFDNLTIQIMAVVCYIYLII